MLRPLFLLAGAVLSLTFAAGCTQPIEEGAASEASASSGRPIIKTPGPRYEQPELSGARFNVFVGTVPCVSVPGAGGTWRAMPTFSDDRSFCEYWWAEKTPFDLPALTSWLEYAGIVSETMVEDVACETMMEVIGAGSACARPVVTAYLAGPTGGGGGQYTCRSCIRASDSGSYVDVVVPQSMVTATPSALYGVFGGAKVGFTQPGRVSTFRVVVPSKLVNSSASASAASCEGPALVTPSSIVQAGGGGCGVP
jgi:hypothetical protein